VQAEAGEYGESLAGIMSDDELEASLLSKF